MKKQTVLNTNQTKIDVESVLNDIGVVVVNAAREIACQCPFHTDRHPSFSINSETGLWLCFQCGATGTLEQLVEQVAGEVVFPGLREIKRSRLHPPNQTPESYVRSVEARTLAESEDPYYLYAKYMSFSDPPDWALDERNLWPDDCARYGIRWRKGWIIPIWAPRKTQDVAMDFWGWQAKRMDVVMNYPAGIKKSQTLFGMNVLKVRQLCWWSHPSTWSAWRGLVSRPSPLTVPWCLTIKSASWRQSWTGLSWPWTMTRQGMSRRSVSTRRSITGCPRQWLCTRMD